MATRYLENPMTALGVSEPVLSGQTALITGAGSGIGKELALILASLGAQIVIAEISPQGSDTARLIQERKGHARFIQTDVGSEESVRDLFESIRSEEKSLDILVNNAADSPVVPLQEMSLSDWDRVMAVNLRGTFLCCRHALTLMKEQNRGTIINMVSAPSMPYLAAYTAAKEASRSMVHSLAGELEETAIHVIGYAPGMVETPGAVRALKQLAPLIHVPYEELVNSGFNPGYDGLIPAYDAALVLSHIICRPSKFHNQTVTIDEAASFLPGGSVSVDDEPVYDCDRIRELMISVRNEALELLHAVESTDEEFNRLPFFVRTMARSGFRRKVGVAVGDLKDLLLQIHQVSDSIVDTLAESNQDPEELPRTDIAQCLLHCSQIVSILSQLEQYYEEVPQEMSRFIRDEKALREVMHTCQERVQMTKSLRTAAESTRTL